MPLAPPKITSSGTAVKAGTPKAPSSSTPSQGGGHKRKFSTGEVLVWLTFAAGFDALDFFFDLPIADFTYTPAWQFYMFMKGAPGNSKVIALVGNIAEAVPVVDLLPIRTLDALLIFYADWQPKSFMGKVVKASTLLSISPKGALETAVSSLRADVPAPAGEDSINSDYEEAGTLPNYGYTKLGRQIKTPVGGRIKSISPSSKTGASS